LEVNTRPRVAPWQESWSWSGFDIEIDPVPVIVPPEAMLSPPNTSPVPENQLA
jgi:hypothetical protein